MDKHLVEFAENADTKSVNRLIALSEVIKGIPTEKMAKAKSLKVTWRDIDDELVPELDVEFYE